MSDKKKYYDVTGRGFSLARMWAQYGSNNEGVCFIINKKKLMEQIRSNIELYKAEDVKYKDTFDNYFISDEKIEELYRKISTLSNGTLTFTNLLKKDNEFVKYNYFEKLKDWENEREFRILAYVDQIKYTLTIDHFDTYVEGVVVGEKIDPAYEHVIRALIKEKCKDCLVKKISFENYICRVK